MSKYHWNYHHGCILYDKEVDSNINNDNDEDGPDEVPIVIGSCLFFSDHQNNTSYYNKDSLSSCTKFYGDANYV